MTDNEIIKALECCGKPVNEECCSECPYHLGGEELCHKLIGDTIELINRQKAEIERLERHTEMYHEVRAEAVKEFAERLKEKFACLEYVIQTNRKTLPIERVKAEVDAVLQNGCSNVVDKILKEMVGEG